MSSIWIFVFNEFKSDSILQQINSQFNFKLIKNQRKIKTTKENEQNILETNIKVFFDNKDLQKVDDIVEQLRLKGAIIEEQFSDRIILKLEPKSNSNCCVIL